MILSDYALTVSHQLLDVVVLIRIERQSLVHLRLEPVVVLLQDLIVEIVVRVLLHSGDQRAQLIDPSDFVHIIC